MKRLIILLLSGVFCIQVYSQIVDEKLQRKITTGVDLYTDIWLNTPTTIDPGAINWGANIYALYMFPFSDKSPLSLAIGIGLGIHKMYNDGLLVVDTNGVSEFINFDKEYPKLDYKKNKFAVDYLDFPMELRYLAENGVRFSAGIKIGALLQSKTKYRGDDYLNGTNDELKVKFLSLPNIENYRVAATLRIGWKWIGIYGAYSITKAFTPGSGPEMYPISVGLSLFPY